jgi:serine/threonine protein kinase
LTLTPGTRLGVYEVAAQIGAGGMGEVYQATDTKLKRQVAIKILPAALAGDRDRLARFQREAEVLASLNHPNIAAIHGLEEAGGSQALIMELVEGEDLSAIIARGQPETESASSRLRGSASAARRESPQPSEPGVGPRRLGRSRVPRNLSIDDTLRIAKQIAEALEAAHDQGVIHRDLKPANIKVRADGTVKVLDFGLAKALDPAGSPNPPASALADSPTFMSPAGTELGMILGTAAYMAPEQARGRAVDRRADIWSFGCVLYELLTGRKVFDGDNIAEILARVLQQTPDWTLLPSETPDDVRRLLVRCLTKDSKARLRDIGEARVLIDDHLTGRSAVSVTNRSARPPPRTARWRRVLPWTLAAALGLLAAGLYFGGQRAAMPPQAVHAEINLPADVEFYSGPSVSADGSAIAFVAVREGVRQVYLRSLHAPGVRAIAGTDSSSTVAISPDGTAAAFISPDTRVRRVVWATGIIEPLADGALVASGPAWLSDGSIVFSRGARLIRLTREGDERELAAVDERHGEVSLSWPIPAAGDRHIIFASRRDDPRGVQFQLHAVPVGGGARQLVLDGAEQAIFASTDRLVFKRGEALFTVPFDAAALRVAGDPVRVDQLPAVAPTGGVAAAVGASGTLVIAPPSVLHSQLVWVSMLGVERPIRSAARGYLSPRVSPSGGLIAFAETNTIWTLDPERNTLARVSGSDTSISFPAWSRDGASLYYRSGDGIRVQRADGVGAATVLPNTGATDYPNSVTPDGRTLLFQRISPATASDLYTIPAAGGEATPLVVTSAYEAAAQVSPDGKWIVYVSNESGRMEVYLRSFGGIDRKLAVSSGGGLHALWSRDGRRIFYRSGQQMMAVDVTTVPDVRLGEPQVLFEKRFSFGQSVTLPNISLSADGREFLMVQEVPGGRHFDVVLNWLQGTF